jgi:5-methyltetrahydrofolate--homocysteine methyltransferase
MKASADELAALSVEERLERRIVDGDPDGIEADLDAALTTHPPLEIINAYLLAGMRTVGELFADGRMQLPFVLQSAQTMKTAVAHLEPHIAAAGGASASAKGKVLIATVKGDVHDIGKNLVDIILRNNGYEVVNLGIKQSIDQILAAAEEHGVDAIGMSGLLVKSTVIMRENLEEMNHRGVAHFPVLLGGAALTRGYVEDDLRTLYDGSVFYCKDAFEALRVLASVLGGEGAEDGGSEASAEALAAPKPRRARPAPRAAEAPPAVDSRGRPRSLVASDVDVPVPPFWGTRIVRGVPIDEVVPLINEVALFRNQWGFTPGDLGPDGYRELIEREARPVLRELVARAKAERIVSPSVVYGYYPANGDGDDVVVWDPEAPLERELARFHFPRQDRGRFLCIADFLRSVDGGVPDVLGVQVVTMGHRITEVAAELFVKDAYQDYLYTHGFGVEMAEALAELWHRRMRVELGIAGDDGPTPHDWFRQGYRGSRYSFGYPACPNLEDQEPLFRLVDPSPIGVSLTDEFMLHPEQSTSAIVLHHPEATYFNARERAEDATGADGDAAAEGPSGTLT